MTSFLYLLYNLILINSIYGIIFLDGGEGKMLESRKAIEILKEGGFDSLTSYPLIYHRKNKVGLTYTFNSVNYGNLERVKIFKNEDDLRYFVKEIAWYRKNGEEKNVQVVLDDYTAMDPVVVFKHNGQEIDYDKMVNIDKYEEETLKELESSDVKRIIFEIERLFGYYDERQEAVINYIDGVNKSLDVLYNSYKLLQKRIDLYNGFKEEREYTAIKLNKLKFNKDKDKLNAIKDQFNYMKVNDTPYEEYQKLLKNLWSLCMDIELNDIYIKAMKRQNEIVNEQNVVNKKLNFMERELNRKKFKFIKNIRKNFAKIEKSCEYTELDEHYDDVYRNQVIDRYKKFQEINIFNATAYLKESLTNNSAGLITKYKERLEISLDSEQVTENIIIEDLDKKLNALSQEDKDKLTLLNSEYLELFKMLLNLDDFRVKSGEELLQSLSKNEGFNALMTRCYTLVNELMPFNEDENVLRVLGNLNFASQGIFLYSLAKVLDDILNINTKLDIKDNIVTYYRTLNIDNQDKLIQVYFNNERVLSDYKSESLRYVIATLKKGLKVFYSNKTIVIPKNGETEIKYINNEYNSLILLNNDIVIDKNSQEAVVTNYRGNIVREANYSFVDELKKELDFIFVEWEITPKM